MASTVTVTETNNNNNNNNNIKNDCTIEEFFANKNVFLTGGTGFLGTIVIEALLSCSPNIGKIYLLVRGKYGSDPTVRITRLLSKQIFESHSPETLKKIVPLIGELNAPNFGLSDEQYADIVENVNIIYHCAATINFNTPLREAIKTNLIGTWRTIELAKKLNSLASYVYLSTAFCNSNNRGLINEKIYPASYDPHDLIQRAQSPDSYLPDRTDPKLLEFLKGHPNTYTFTKQLSENLIAKEMTGLPAGIVRPSVIYGTYKHPVEGWSGNATSGHLGFLAGFMKGVFRTISGNPESILDIIPADYVVSAAISMGWYLGTHEVQELEIIHATSGQVNPLSLTQLCQVMNKEVRKHPADLIAFKPHTKIRTGLRYKLCFYLFHILPALFYYIPEKIFDIGKPQHTALQYMRVFDKGHKAFEFFLNKNFEYELKNSLRLMSQLNQKDVKRYCFDATYCNWSLLIERCFKGLRYYYYRESKETTFKHTIIWNFAVVFRYFIFALQFLFFAWIGSLFLPIEIALVLALAILSFIIWL